MTTTQRRLVAQLAFDSATLMKWSSSTQFAKKPMREMSENVRLFVTVNGTGIANGHKKFFSFILVLCLIFVLHTPISRVLPVVSCHFFHSLNTAQFRHTPASAKPVECVFHLPLL